MEHIACLLEKKSLVVMRRTNRKGVGGRQVQKNLIEGSIAHDTSTRE